jgi:hypothetical protein
MSGQVTRFWKNGFSVFVLETDRCRLWPELLGGWRGTDREGSGASS